MNSEELASHALSTRMRTVYWPLLEARAASMRVKYPAARVRAFQHSVGALTDFQAYSIGLECSFARDVPGCSDNLALEITVCHLDKTPRINAGVAWGSSEHAPLPEPAMQERIDALMPADFFADWSTGDEWPQATPETMTRLEEDLPRLLKGLDDVIAHAVAVV